MNKLMFVTAFSFLAPLAANAHGTKIAMTAASLDVAAEMFEAQEAASLKDYIGVKAWPDADKIQVKVLLNNNKFVQYACKMNNEDVVCAKQP